MRRWQPALALAVVLVATGVRVALATLTNTGVTATSSFTAAPDWQKPTATASTGAKVTGYLAGSVKQTGTYYAYANVTDGGAPASGVSTVTANLSNITTGATAVALSSGSYSVNGVSYNYRSTSQTANGSVGSKSWTLTMTDAAGNSDTVSGTAVTIENTAPAATDVQTANKAGGTAGKAELGDTITLTVGEAIDPESLSSGWTGTGTADVVVRLIDGGCILSFLVEICSDDSFQVWNAANSTLLLGTVDLNDTDYNVNPIIGTAPTITFGASGTHSTMTRSSDGLTLTITLGTASATADTASGNTTMQWAPAAVPYDAAGNLLSTATADESGAGDREF